MAHNYHVIVYTDECDVPCRSPMLPSCSGMWRCAGAGRAGAGARCAGAGRALPAALGLLAALLLLAARRDSRVVLTSELYEAGHSRPHAECCPARGAALRLLVLVTSAPGHAAAREAVRLSWGHAALRRDIGFAFVLGSLHTRDEAKADAIRAEDELYGDIIIGNSRDSYSNLTLKTLSMLEWVHTYCPKVPRLLKTDDDMFINIPRLLKFIDARKNETRTIWGHVSEQVSPQRTMWSKYYVSPLQYPPKVFPDHTNGPAYLMTTDVVGELIKAAGQEPYLRLEDVFVTGVLASKLKIKRQHAAEFLLSAEADNEKVSYHPCTVQKCIAIHMVRNHEQFHLWRKVLDGTTKCEDA
ncbi:beta-1,3-galactosyltransferase 5 [Plutella xylostella]|uniref:beta-1,3-galactosyltransferase 5 n=1 Tax=Plutella xylostella TaxID=51655 RepID=UPI002032BF61|nr:beta-1,3-galactosyltransferase 5 [Plutella xylostella]